MDVFSFKNWLIEAGNDNTSPEPQAPTKSTAGMLQVVLGKDGGAIEGKGELEPEPGEENIPRKAKKKSKKG